MKHTINLTLSTNEVMALETFALHDPKSNREALRQLNIQIKGNKIYIMATDGHVAGIFLHSASEDGMELSGASNFNITLPFSVFNKKMSEHNFQFNII